MPIEAKDAQDARGYGTAQDETFYARQRELLTRVVAESDVVITAAVVPGKKSPVLITAEMVKGMAPGSVIVDLASERRGNCELTRTGETVTASGVSIIGAINLASSVPYHASQMYARNVAAFLAYMVKDGKLQLNLQDEIIRETMVTRGGEIVNARVREFFKLPALVAQWMIGTESFGFGRGFSRPAESYKRHRALAPGETYGRQLNRRAFHFHAGLLHRL